MHPPVTVLRVVVICLACAFWGVAIAIPPNYPDLKGGFLFLFLAGQMGCAFALARRLDRSGIAWAISALLTFCLGPITLAFLGKMTPVGFRTRPSAFAALLKWMVAPVPQTKVVLGSYSDPKKRRCPKCGKVMRFGSNSEWRSGGVWWCDRVNPPYGCGYEITPQTHPEEFRNYNYGGDE